MSVTNLPLRDFHSIPNALMHGSSDAATVSFDVTWQGVRKEGELRDAANTFSLEFVETDVTVKWSAKKSGFSFTSNVANRSTSVSPFAIVGEERNGVFFEDD